jgi:hypothetical protein
MPRALDGASRAGDDLVLLRELGSASGADVLFELASRELAMNGTGADAWHAGSRSPPIEEAAQRNQTGINHAARKRLVAAYGVIIPRALCGR